LTILITRIKQIKENENQLSLAQYLRRLDIRQINMHDTTYELKRVETDTIRQGVPYVDNTFIEKN